MILRRITDNPLLIIVFSITLPLLNPQILRFVPGGTLNLSFSFILLLPIYFMLKVYENLIEAKRYVWHILILAAITYLSFLIHVYYLLILSVWIGSFYVLLTGYLIHQKRKFISFAISAIGSLLAAGALFYITVTFTDPYLTERNETALGYNHAPWKLQFSSLFTAYHFLKTKFLFSYTKYIPYEAHVYLGGFVLYLIAVLLIIKTVIGNSFFQSLRLDEHGNQRNFVLLLLASTVAPLLIAFGPEYYFGENNDYVFSNYYSLFYHIELNTKKITHFRCLGRFAWPLFWALNIGAIYLITLLLKNRNRWFAAIVIVLVYFNCKDARNAYEFIRTSQVANPFRLQTAELADVKKIIHKDYGVQYQAIVPLPYYHVGSESLDYSVDAEKMHFVKSLAFAYNTGLPLMSSTMSRTSVAQAKQMYSLINNDRANDTLLALLNSKPLLFYIDGSYYPDSTLYGSFDLPIQQKTFYNSRKLVSDFSMPKVAESGNIELYQLNITSLRKGKLKTSFLVPNN
ncbi:MAG: hypothetical protein KIS94_12040 [Chitinophagales bacterium]|nr:hypothetical protein [Chitinophagales bacterium]